MKVCLDLFCGLGGFSAAFEDAADWRVVTVDIEERFDPDVQADVLDLRPADVLEALPVDEWDGMDTFVVLASPPCTQLTTSGNHEYWDFETKQPTGDVAREHVTLLHHTIGLIRGLSPGYWFVENPRHGKATWYLGEPTGTVTYCQYGRPYMKPTGLWGSHPDSFEYLSCNHGDPCHVSNTEHDGTSAIASMKNMDASERAKVPYGLSASILDAVEHPEPRESLAMW